MDNVNNLNGVPNFGHGFEAEVIPTGADELSIDEVTGAPDSEVEEKKAKKKK